MPSIGSHTVKDVGRYTEATAVGVALLRLLKVDISSSPTPIAVVQEIAKTDKVAARYTPNQIINMKASSAIDEKRRNLFRIADAVAVASYREASPYLSLIACAMVNYSLENGVVCEESASKSTLHYFATILLSIWLTSLFVVCVRASKAAFVNYGYFRIFLEANFEEGRKWADIAQKITNSSFTRCKYTCDSDDALIFVGLTYDF